MVEEEENRDDEPGYDGREDPSDRQLPELHKELRAVRGAGLECGADMESGAVERCQFADVWHTHENNDADGGSIFGETHTNVAMEQRFPFLGRGEEDGYQHGTDSTNDGVEECRERKVVVGAFQFLDGLMEVDDAVEERKDFGGEGGHVAHGPVVGVDEGEKEVHPAGVDERPCHEGKKGYLR